tara:strand:- start:877 stop:1110 length:234 start_codon:yes stop_codon:yes gene_type:complete
MKYIHKIETNACNGPNNDHTKIMMSLRLFVQVIKLNTAISEKLNAIKNRILFNRLLGLFEKTKIPTSRDKAMAGKWA